MDFIAYGSSFWPAWLWFGCKANEMADYRESCAQWSNLKVGVRICVGVSLLLAFCVTQADHGEYVYDVMPGSDLVDSSRLHAYRATWAQLGRSDEGLVDSGATFEEILRISSGQIHHTQIMRSPQGAVATEQRVFDRPSLRPLSLVRSVENGPEGAPRSVALQADDLLWSGLAKLPDGSDAPFEYRAETNAFDGWVAGLTLAALPLAKGYQAKLPALVQFQRATYLLHAKVIDQRVHQVAPGVSVLVWVVDTAWLNLADGSVSAGGADQAGGTYLIAVKPQQGQPHVIEYANNGAVIRWAP